MKNRKLTHKQFEEFKRECLRLQKAWGLTGWKLFFNFVPLKDGFAEIEFDMSGRVAKVSFTTELEEFDYKNLRIPVHAKHEMIHLLLARVTEIGHTRFVEKKAIEDAEEEAIRILEKLL